MSRSDKYTKSEIAKRLNEPPRKIQFWVDSGLVVPDVVPPSGRGKAMFFSGRNLIEFGMIQVLQKCSLTLETIKKIFSLLRKGLSKYDDFFIDHNWGIENEIFFTIYQPSNRIIESYEVSSDDKLIWSLFPDVWYDEEINDCLTIQTICLGRIKLQAMKNLDLIKDVKFLDISKRFKNI